MILRLVALLLVTITHFALMVRPHAAAFLIAGQAPTVTPDPGPSKQLATDQTQATENNRGWFPFDTAPDPFTNCPIDLRFLNLLSPLAASRDGYPLARRLRRQTTPFRRHLL